ncbi:MAG: 30S ribosomal protein S20 [Flavobacteriales bacterium]
MANHKSAKKRVRSDKTKTLRNKYYHKTTRNAIRDLRSESEKTNAVEMLPKVVAMIDKLAKRNIIHKNKANNLKSKLSLKVAGM